MKKIFTGRKALIIVFCFCLFQLHFLEAQDMIKGCYYIGGFPSDHGNTIIQAANGDLVIGGSSESYSLAGTEQNFYVTRIGLSGNVIWASSVGGPVNGDNCIRLIETSDHSILAVGSSAAVNYIRFMVKYDADGNILWQKALQGGASGVLQGSLVDVVENADGNYMVLSYIIPYAASSFVYAYVAIMNPDGEMLWQNAVVGTYSDFYSDYPHRLVNTSDGGFAISGNCQSGMFLHTFNADRTPHFSRYIPGGINYSMTATPDSGFVLAGYTYEYIFEPTEPFTQLDAYAVKIDKNGDLVWSKTFGDSLNEIFYDVELTDDGGFIFSGKAEDPDYTNSDKIKDAFLVRTDAEGVLQWSELVGNNEWNDAYDIVQLNNGGYAVTGNSHAEAPGSNLPDIFVGLFDANGNICEECNARPYGKEGTGGDISVIIISEFSDTCVVADTAYIVNDGYTFTEDCLESYIAIPETENHSLHIYPNPAHEYISVDLPCKENFSVYLTNTYGQQLLTDEDNMSEGHLLLHIKNYIPGIYIMHIESEKISFSQKIVLE